MSASCLLAQTHLLQLSAGSGSHQQQSGSMGNAPSISLAINIAGPIAGGFAVSLLTKDDIKGWYKRIRKPSWTPPNWVFGPMWTALYAMMGVAAWMVQQQGVGRKPMILYGIQLALNLIWNPIFFKGQLTWAVADIAALLGVLTATIVEFHKVKPEAAYLLLPYLAWTSYAAALTADIWKRNRKDRRVPRFAQDAVQHIENAIDGGHKGGPSEVQRKVSERARTAQEQAGAS